MGIPARLIFIFILGFSTTLLPGASSGGESPAGEKGVAVPDAKAQAASLKLIKDLYKDDYAKAKLPPAKTAFAKKLLEQGMATRDDPVARYVLLLEARDLASDAGDAKTALLSIDEISRRYLEVSALEMKSQALEKISKSAKASDVQKRLAESAIELADAALQVGNYAIAKKAFALAGSTAAKAKAKHLAVWAGFRARQTAECEKEAGPAKEAMALLRRTPGDPDANLIAGRFRALLKEEWEAGLALLRRSIDFDLKTLAEKELAIPAKASEKVALGDLWLIAAEKMALPFKTRAHARATVWYERALPGLEGLSRTKVEDKLSRALAGAGDLKPGLVAELFDGRSLKRKKKVRIDPQVNFDWGLGAPDKDLPPDRFSIRWTGKLMAPSPGKYTLSFQTDDGLRLWLDDELLVDQWAFGARSGEVAVFLTDKPHELRIEHYDEFGIAKMVLSWRREGGEAEAVVPAYAFFHDAETERAAKK